ncbi:MAG: class I adenylate-forming enzyme family protein [Candidatus Thioglobus sp.]|nr:hypothetical protein [Gammaproteobacteria bacterium]MDP6163852.1 class I adenylate-forming enzyme family protein [Candidatus Thioglobus sp.]
MSIEAPSTFKHTTISEGIRSVCSENPSKVAYKHGQKTRTYRELSTRMNSIASLIGSFEIPQDSNIAIVASNSIEYMEIVLAAAQLGHPIATVNPKLTAIEIVSICKDAESKLIFADERVCSLLEENPIQCAQAIICIDELEEIDRAGQSLNLPTIHESKTFTIPYTSGTTGKPKGVLVPHRSRSLTLYGMAEEYGCFSSDDRFLSIAPMCHGAGMIFSLAPIFFGGYAELMDSFDPELVMKTLEEGEITGFFGVPTHFYGMLDVDRSTLEACPGSSLKTIISNASALPQSLKEKIVGHFGEGLLYECYGSTEGGIISNLRPDDQLRKKQCVGEPFPYTEIKLLNDDGEECAVDEVGEVFTASPYIFNGYWRKEKETDAAFDGKWLTVGDLAKKDADGFLYIVDRKKDMIISGGINIYPREIEEVLLEHPEINEVAVIGHPDDKWGEIIKAFIVYEGQGILSVDDVQEFCKDKIASIKMPKIIEKIEALPRNANGKILKRELRGREA